MNTKSINTGFHKLFHLHVDKEMVEVSLFQFFVNLGRNLIILALPFYMYKTLGYEIWQICMFFLLWQVSFAFVMPFVGGFIDKVGLKHAMATRSIGAAIFWVTLPLLLRENFWMSVGLVAPFFLLRAFSRSVSEISYDIFLVHHINREMKGKTLAWLQIAIMSSVVLAPVLGGLITRYLGFQWTSYFAFLFFLTSGIVLMMTPDEKFHVPYTAKKLLKDVFTEAPKELFMAEFGRVFFDAVLWIVWPIFLILIFKDIVSIGNIVGFSSGLAIIVMFFVGRGIDQRGIKKKSFRFGAYRSMAINFFRGVMWDPIALAVVDALHKINSQAMQVPYDAEIQKWLREKDTFERAHIRWMIAENMYTVAVAFFVAIFYMVQEEMKWAFIIIFAVGSLSMLLTQTIAKFED